MNIPVESTELVPVRAPGVVLQLTPNAVPARAAYELERAADVAGAPGSWLPWQRVRVDSESGQTLIDLTPAVGLPQWYRARIVAPGLDPGAWSPARRILSRELPPAEQIAETIYPLQRGQPMTDGSYAANSVTPNGTTLPAGAVQTDGVGNRAMLKGFQTGRARDGDAVVFDPPFAAPPTVVISGGLSYEPRASQWTGGAFDATEPQYEMVDAQNLSASGFTVQARLRQPVASVLRTHLFSAALLNIGDTAAVTLGHAPAYDGVYVVRWRVDFSNGTLQDRDAMLRAAVDVSADGGGTWTERDSGLFSMLIPSGDTGSVTYSSAITVSALDPTDQIRLRLADRDEFAVVLEVICDRVTYLTAASVRTASKTPDANDRCTWTAYAKE